MLLVMMIILKILWQRLMRKLMVSTEPSNRKD
jgi:hypothetical protein